MVNLRGESEVVLDVKGRMAIPASHRDALREQADGQMVVAKHPLDACLVLYPLPVWLPIEERIGSLPSFESAYARGLQRNFVGKSENVQMDKSGRILLPGKFRDKMSLDKKVVLVGLGNKFEIWRDDLWQEQDMDFSAEAAAEMPESIKGLVV